MKITAYKLVTIFALIASVGFASSVSAEDAIDVEYNNGSNINGGKILHEDHAYPGWSKTKKVIVKNKSTVSAVDLYMVFDINKGKTLADVLKLYVIKDDTGSYRVGGAGDHYTLKKADGDDLFIGTLDPGEKETYKIKVKFDKDAGNEYQNLSTKFDIDFTIEGETSEGFTPQQILAAQGRTVSGEAPEDEVGNDEGTLGAADGEQSIGGDDKDEGVVAGAETCSRWPLWAWLVMIGVYGILIYLIGRKAVDRLEMKRNLLWQILLTLITLALWYFFDTCSVYLWVPVVIIVGGVVLAVVLYQHTVQVQQ